MQVTVTGRHFEITDPLRQHIESKLNKLDRYLDGITDVHVVLSVEKHRHIAEINLQANGSLIRGVEEKHDMYLAVDTVIEKIERQVKRQKDKDSDRKGRFANKTQDLVSTETVESEEFKAPPKVIRTQRMAIKPMSIDEAAMQLGLTKEDFLAFLNSETNQMNVMYKRRDGNYGLIEPEF
ncbi:MAG: ribosome-associated translation inhibitor RaiA [Candidatus Vecturithrix sp.]|jgi:putative sigma-54 modulation protein|nr:ribosome-associated translation inhibitor RaiA [Candidatus Vecturithrix sp.]